MSPYDIKMLPLRAIICLLVGTAIWFAGCRKDPLERIPGGVQPYVEQFFLEGQLRGYDLFLEDYPVKVEFAEIEDPEIVGLCRHLGLKITIDPIWWSRANDAKRRWLVYHELGHCVLGREHRNQTTAAGTCLSYMRGAEGGFECSLDLHSAAWTEYYLDELFGPTASLPEWVSQVPEYDASFLADHQVLQWQDTLVDLLSVNMPNLPTDAPFWLEAQVANWETEEYFVVLSLGSLALKSCNLCTVGKVAVYLFNGQGTFFEQDDSFIYGRCPNNFSRGWAVYLFLRE